MSKLHGEVVGDPIRVSTGDGLIIEEAISRVVSDPLLVRALVNALHSSDASIWIWGSTGLAILSIVNSIIDGRLVWIDYLQSDKRHSFSSDRGLRDRLSKLFDEWGRSRGAIRIAGAVSRQGPWYRLTGYKPWKLIISKEI